MKRIREPDDSSFSSEFDHWRFEDLFEEHAGTEIVTTEQESMPNWGQSDNQNLSMQSRTSRQTQIDRPNLLVFFCDVCTYQTQNMLDYIEHKQTHEASRNFVCLLCRIVFEEQTMFVQHMEIYHTIHNQSTDNILRCDQCAYTTENTSYLNKHKKTHVNISDFQCSICGGKFGAQYSLTMHYKHVHNQLTDGTHRCDQCAYTTENTSHFNKHKKTHVNISDFQCSICGGKFGAQYSLTMHYKHVHNQLTDSIYRCDQCAYTTNFHYYLNRHKEMHVDISDFQCNICGGKFGAQYSLTMHYKHVHNQSTNSIYRCDQCAYTTKYSNDLNRHKQTHVDISDFQCNICGGKFGSHHSLTLHNINVHNQSTDITHRCDQCLYTTNYKNNFERHKKTHFDISDFQSSTCGEQFTEQINLKSHYSDIHNPSNVVPHDLLTPQAHDFLYCELCKKHFETKRGFDEYNINKHPNLICQICFQRFTTTDSFMVHVRRHDIQPLYTCSICHKQWETTESLHSHMQEHKNELHKRCAGKILFYCELCKLYLETKNELDEHNKIHSHVCHVCSKKFQTRESLNMHMPTHNKISFVCSLCDEEFKTIEELHAHSLNHLNMPQSRSEAELSECRVCGKQCETPDDLISHIENNCDSNLPVNRPETPDVSRFEETNQPGPSGYRCHICKEKLKNNDDLIVHMTEHGK